MSQILLLNARRPKKRRAKKKATTRKRPAKKRTTKRTTARKTVARKATRKKGAYSMATKRKRTVRRKAPRRNPSRKRRVARKVARRASSSVAGLNFKGALKNIPMATLGMFAAKWAAKRFGEAATETDPNSWNYASYLKGALGAAAAGFAANMVKRGSGQKVMEGGLSLMLYKLVQNELIPQSPWATGQFGASERVPGVIEENSEGMPFVLGEDNQWYPLEGADDWRMDEEMDQIDMYGYGSDLVAPGPLGDTLTTPGPLGASDLDTLYTRSFLKR